ncbi:hypothetical protein Syun_019014 [Stephania yunnanensis]|uniref:Uncharacterized protein n=1 Tax=Stephania yunnanensis TaxID=152371 RepID=A0AAP0IV97_9MAGN
MSCSKVAERIGAGAAAVRRAEPAARRGLAAELQQQWTNGATPAKAADALQQRWRRLSIGGAAAVADRRRGGCVGWCGCGLVGAGTTPATPAAAERREEPARIRRRRQSEVSVVRPAPALVPLVTLIGREVRGEKVEKPSIKFGQVALAKKGEGYFLFKLDCLRIPENSSTSFSVFAIFDGHNGISSAIFAKENLLNHVMSAIPQGIDREESAKTAIEAPIYDINSYPSILKGIRLNTIIKNSKCGVFNGAVDGIEIACQLS